MSGVCFTSDSLQMFAKGSEQSLPASFFGLATGHKAGGSGLLGCEGIGERKPIPTRKNQLVVKNPLSIWVDLEFGREGR